MPGERVTAEVVQVIMVVSGRGRGTDSDPFRRVTSYFTMDGVLLVEKDPSGG